MARSTPAWRTVAMLAAMTVLYTPPASAQAARARLVINDVTVPFEAGGGSSVATFTISFADATSHGAVNNGVFTVTMSAASGKPVTVQVQSVAGTAAAGNCGTAGADFAPPATSLTFPATSGPGGTNSPAQTVSVPVCGDAVREGNEQFQLRLSNASNATIADPTGAATITDDDPVPTLAIAANVAVDEPVGLAMINAVFNVTLAGGAPQTTQTVTVGYVTANVTAIGGTCVPLGSGKADYGTKDGTLTFPPGGPLVQQIHIPICRDLSAEPDQTFTVTLRDESNATVLNRVGTATIRGTANP